MKNQNLIEFLNEKFNECKSFYFKLETNKGTVYVNFTQKEFLISIHFKKTYNITIEFFELENSKKYLDILKNDFNCDKVLIINILVKEEN